MRTGLASISRQISHDYCLKALTWRIFKIAAARMGVEFIWSKIRFFS